jgi:hypothetical protein
LTESGNGKARGNLKEATPFKGRLATCSYRAFRPEFGHALRITRFPPRWKLPYELAGSVMILDPTWQDWKLAKGGGSAATFVDSYTARIDTLGANTIETALESLGLSGTLVLLCFESLAGIPSEEQRFICHRRAFADWWMVQTGDPVPELRLAEDSEASLTDYFP